MEQNLGWKLFGAALGLTVLIVVAVFFKSLRGEKPNILVIQLSSLNYNFLSPEVTPNISRFVSKSQTLRNVYIERVNLQKYSIQDMPLSQMSAAGYTAIGDPWSLKGIAVNSFDVSQMPPSCCVSIESVHLEDGLGWVEKKIRDISSRPFFLKVRIDYLEPPYYKPELRKKVEKKLPVDLANRLRSYYLKPLAFVPQIPIHFLLFGSRSVRVQNSKFKPLYKVPIKNVNPESVTFWNPLHALSKDPENLKKWKLDPWYRKDTEILKVLYRAQLRYLDARLERILKLYEDKGLMDSTIVVLYAKRGEALMEHGLLADEGAYSSVSRTPVYIRYPRQKSQVKFDQQLSSRVLKIFLGKTMEGLGREGLASFLDRHQSPYVYSMGRGGRSAAVRENNQTSVVFDRLTQKYQQFDLSKDFDETQNTSDSEVRTELIEKIKNFIERAREKRNKSLGER